MLGIWYTIFSILDILLQSTAAFFSYQIYTFHKLSKGWLAVPLGFVLMGLRRIFIYSYTQGYIGALPSISPILDSLIVPFLVSLMLVFGIWAMYNNFQTFSLTEKEVEEKVQDFKKRAKGEKRR